MAIEKKKKEINGVVYLVAQMDGVRALKTQAKLISLLGSGVLNLLGGTAKPDELMQAIKPVLDDFNDKKAVNFVLSLFEKGVFEEIEKNDLIIPKKIDFSEHFAGRINDAWQVVAFILEVNFAMGES